MCKGKSNILYLPCACLWMSIQQCYMLRLLLPPHPGGVCSHRTHFLCVTRFDSTSHSHLDLRDRTGPCWLCRALSWPRVFAIRCSSPAAVMTRGWNQTWKRTQADKWHSEQTRSGGHINMKWKHMVNMLLSCLFHNQQKLPYFTLCWTSSTNCAV